MAVTQTGAIYKSLSFDNTSSRSYGVYITGEAVYNAPEREVEMISIPGRNGSFALDKGRFENIEVTYPAGIFANNETDFAAAISDFRNFLCSKNGYCRLTDEYNPNEYRMAVYKSGLEVDPAQLRAGEFDITFNCKPQRFLTSGETATTVANNGTMSNPTLFDSSPLLAVKGYGNIGFNGQNIKLENVYLGNVKIADAQTGDLKSTKTTTVNDTQSLDVSLLNTSDTIAAEGIGLVAQAKRLNGTYQFKTASISSTTGCSASCTVDGSGWVTVNIKLNALSFVKGTSSSGTASVTFTGTDAATPPQTNTFTLNITVSYDGNATITYSRAFTSNFSGSSGTQVMAPEIYGDSTQSALGTPTYIDCDLGAAYKVESATVVSLNHVIDLGSELPTLAPGTNTFTKDNTITELKVTPRWYKL